MELCPTLAASATPAGAVTSMVTGLGTAVLWEFWLGPKLVASSGDGGLAVFLSTLDAALPAVCVSIAALVVVSSFTKPRAELVG